MDGKIAVGSFMLISIAILIFTVDSYQSPIYAIKGGIGDDIKDSSIDSLLPLPFNSHIADASNNDNQKVYANDLIPFP